RRGGAWNTTRSGRTRRWATGHRPRKQSCRSNRGMEIWKTLRVFHIPTPPATTTDNCPTRRYTNTPLGTKNRSGHTINAPYAWGTGLDGTGIGVAVIDSGIYDMPDLHGAGPGNSGKTRVAYNQNFTSAYFWDTYDHYGHGTHVAGIVGGDGSKSTGSQYFYTFNGIAPNVSLINLRVLDQNGAGTDSQVISAIQTAIALKSKYKIRVINLSLGRPVYESYTLDPLCQAVEAAYQAGIVV